MSDSNSIDEATLAGMADLAIEKSFPNVKSAVSMTQVFPEVLDKHGNPATHKTKPEDISSWPTYLLLVEQSYLTLNFGTTNPDQSFITFYTLLVRSKILLDHSNYFKALINGPWTEATTMTVNLDDINIIDFLNLYRMLYAGTSGFVLNLGHHLHDLRNFINIYLLADRFQFPKVKKCITTAMEMKLNSLAAEWAVGERQAGSSPDDTSDPEQMERNRLLDIQYVFQISKGLMDSMRPFAPEYFSSFVANCYPRRLLRVYYAGLEDDFAIAIGMQLI